MLIVYIILNLKMSKASFWQHTKTFLLGQQYISNIFLLRFFCVFFFFFFLVKQFVDFHYVCCRENCMLHNYFNSNSIKLLKIYKHHVYEMYNAWTTSLAYLFHWSWVSPSKILGQSVQKNCFKKRVREAEISLTQLYQTIHKIVFRIQFLTM